MSRPLSESVKVLDLLAMAKLMSFSFPLLFGFLLLCEGVFINQDAENVLVQLITDFEQNPNDGRYDHIILTSNENCIVIPKVFIWCPITHFQLQLLCPIHNAHLVCEKWTSVLAKESYLNPRLAYDLGGNVIFVQRIYGCVSSTGSSLPKHTYLSASKTITNIIPTRFLRQIPIILQYRSAFTIDLRDDLWKSIQLGQNFHKISERLASLNFCRFHHRYTCSTGVGNYEDLQE